MACFGDGAVPPAERQGGRTLNFRLLVTVTAARVTRMRPLTAAGGTTAVICSSESTVKLVAGSDANPTAVAPVNPEPVIRTIVPAGPLIGVNEAIAVIVGRTVKFVALRKVPPPVVTLIFPVVAPAGTVARIDVGETTAKTASVPLNVTLLASANPEPLTTTVRPTRPDLGEKEVILAWTTKTSLVAVPPGVTTLIGPVMAPMGTVVTIDVGEGVVNLARTPLKLTDVAPSRFEPVMVTRAPVNPVAGVTGGDGGQAVVVRDDGRGLRPGQRRRWWRWTG